MTPNNSDVVIEVESPWNSILWFISTCNPTHKYCMHICITFIDIAAFIARYKMGIHNFSDSNATMAPFGNYQYVVFVEK